MSERQAGLALIDLVADGAQPVDVARIRRALRTITLTEGGIEQYLDPLDRNFFREVGPTSPPTARPRYHAQIQLLLEVCGGEPDAVAIACAPLALIERLLEVIEGLQR